MKMYALELNKGSSVETLDLYDFEGQALQAGNELKQTGKLDGILSMMRVDVDKWGQYKRKDSLFITAWV